MLRKSYLSLIFLVLPLFSWAEVSEKNEDQFVITLNLEDCSQHIKQEKFAIMKERAFVLEMYKQIEVHFQNILKDSYRQKKEQCLFLLNKIMTSSEFAITVDKVTTIQMISIVMELAEFKDIVIDPSNFPLKKKVDDEVAKANFDETTEQLFNAMYVVAAVNSDVKMLLEKLEIAEKYIMNQEPIIPMHE